MLLLKLQGCLLLDVLHHLRYVYIIGARHLGRVVHAVERRDVVQERREALALGVAASEELLAHLVVDVGIFEYGLQIALYACHGCLEFVGYVLRQLAFEYVLFAPCRLQALVYLDDALGYFAQLVGRKCNEVFRVERLTVVGSRGKSAQFLHVVAQSAREAIEHYGEQKYRYDGKPNVVLVGLQRTGEVAGVWQCRAYDDRVVRKIRGRIEIVAVERLAAALHGRA